MSHVPGFNPLVSEGLKFMSHIPLGLSLNFIKCKVCLSHDITKEDIYFYRNAG